MFTHTEEVLHSVTPPIHLSTSWTKYSDHHPDRTLQSYTRTVNPNFAHLEEAIQKIYSTSKTVLTCSGMAAISATLNSFLDFSQPSFLSILADNELYCDTERLLKNLSLKFSVNVTQLDLTDLKAVSQYCEEWKKKYPKQNGSGKGAKTSQQKKSEDKDSVGSNSDDNVSSQEKQSRLLLFTESCSNPSGRLIDTVSLWKSFHDNKIEVIIIVDNSWLSGIYNPFDYKADVVIESLSKYIGGGDLIMGAVTGRSGKIMNPIMYYTYANGIRTSPFDAYNALKSMQTLLLRLQKSGTITIQLAQWLETLPCVKKVLYPLLPSHPTYEIAKKCLPLTGPSVLYFLLPCDKKTAIAVMDSSEKILFATSYGKPETLFDPYPNETTEGTWVRLAIGYAVEMEVMKNELARMFSTQLSVEVKKLNKNEYKKLEEIPVDSDDYSNTFLIYGNGNFVPLKEYLKYKAGQVGVYKWIKKK